jgi:hypothetical protein
MSLTRIEEALLLAAYFRGGSHDQKQWNSNSDQILTLSLFYTGDISETDCACRFAIRSHIQELYDESGELTEEIDGRYKVLINLLQEHPELIEGGGNLATPAYPTFTACRLTDTGLALATTLVTRFPNKPDFTNWPDRRQ